MNAIVALILALALVNASYVTKYPMDFSKRRSIMQVMVEVENKLKNGGPIETINNVLAGFKDSINREQISHDEVYGAQKTECDSELAYRTTEVLDATNALRTAGAAISQATTAQGKASAQLAAAQDLHTQSQQHLSIINDVAKSEQEAFARASSNHADALNAIENAVDLAEELGNGASFLEVARTSAKLLKHAVVLHKTALFKSVIGAFAQITAQSTEVDQASVERLVQLLNTLKDNLVDAFQLYSEANSDSLAAYQSQKEQYDAHIERLTETEESLAEDLDEYGNTIGTNTALSQSASNKKQRNQALLDDATELCTAVDSEYQAATQGRRNELVLVAELERLVARRAAQFAEGN